MDGLIDRLELLEAEREFLSLETAAVPEPGRQRSLRQAIDCVGVGLHSGQRVHLAVAPADAGTGIRFHRTDLGPDAVVEARHDRVAQTRLCTELADGETRVGTVEHLLAALSACGVDNALVSLDGPEVPILDGSAAPFVFLIDCAGIAEQDASRRVVEVLRPVRVTDGEAFAELRPGGPGLSLSLSIDFAATAIGRQALSLRLDESTFRTELARCRTFTEASEVEALRAAGFARGGSLSNAVVVEGARVLNPGGLRHEDEFVRHKLLDVVGDLALAGARLRGRFLADRTGHRLNNRLLHALFADRANWRAAPAAWLN